MVDKDATKKTRRSKKLAGEGEAETRRNKKNATPALGEDEIQQYDDEARKKEKKIAANVAAAVFAELGISDNDNDGVQEPKTKRKVVLESVPSDMGVASAKEKKKRIKSSTAVEDAAAEEIRSTMKKRKNKETVSNNPDVFSLGTSVPHGGPSKSKSRAERKKKATSADDTSAVVETVSAPDKVAKKSKKSKKRKHVESLSADGETVTSTPDNVAEGQLPKKKRKGETKISDPAQDKSLSEQALKGLSYAFLQYCNPAEWKFNKARQNWIIRNIWSPTMIPDEHMPLLLWYLKNVKGGARDALVKTCQTHLQPSDQPKDESISPGQTEAETAMTSLFGLSPEVLKKTSDKTQGTERSRATTILEMLEVQ